jgi:hypothetical protein
LTVTGGSLAQGQLATTAGGAVIFSASAITFVKYLNLINRNAIQQQIYVYLRRAGSGSSVLVASSILDQYQRDRLIGKDDALSLSIGDTVEAETTTAAAVDYWISGGLA